MHAIMLITKTVHYEIHNINGLAAVMAEILGGFTRRLLFKAIHKSHVSW